MLPDEIIKPVRADGDIFFFLIHRGGGYDSLFHFNYQMSFSDNTFSGIQANLSDMSVWLIRYYTLYSNFVVKQNLISYKIVDKGPFRKDNRIIF